MNESKQKDLKAQTKSGLYWNFLNQFFRYGFGFVVGLIMARLLSPSDYGITALPGIFIAVAYIFQEGGLSEALIRKKELGKDDLTTAFYYSFVIGIFMYLLLFLSAGWIADFYKTPVLVPLIRVTALSFLWGPLTTAQNVILRRNLDFKTSTKISLVTNVFSSAVAIVFAYCGYGVWALVISGTLSSFLGMLLKWMTVKWLPQGTWSKDSFRYLWNYGNKMMASSLLNTLYINITPVFIGKYYSPGDLGQYNRAQGYAALPSQNITSVIQSVTFPVLSKMQDDNEILAQNYRRMLKTTAFIVFPIMLLLSALARPLVLVLITDKWEECIIYLQIMCFSMMWYPVHAINLNLLQVKGRSDLFLRLEIIKKIIGVAMLSATLPFGILIFCIGNLFTSVISLVINTYYTGKLIQVGFIKQMKDLLPVFFLSLFMFSVILLVNIFIDNLYYQILVGCLLGALIYLGGAWSFHFAELSDVKYILKRK